MMKFQVLGPVNLNSAPQKTTIKTYIMTFWTKVKKAPKMGCFSPKSPPEDANRKTFARVDGTNYTFITIVSTFWQSFRKIQWPDKKLYGKKCHFG